MVMIVKQWHMTGFINKKYLDSLIFQSNKLKEYHLIQKIIIKYAQVEMDTGNYGEYRRILLNQCQLLSEYLRIIFILIMRG
jgi:hypothetical protein